MFQLSAEEKLEVVTNCDHLSKIKYYPVLPYVFTEHGALMAASVLNSARAVEVSVYVVRAFVRLRQMLTANKELASKLAELEHKVVAHDGTLRALITAIRKLMTPPDPKEKKIGFIKESRARYRTVQREA